VLVGQVQPFLAIERNELPPVSGKRSLSRGARASLPNPQIAQRGSVFLTVRLIRAIHQRLPAGVAT